jgi:hypothetical protein
MPWPFTEPGARPPPAPPNYPALREKHRNELFNLCKSYALPWSLPIGADGLIGGSDFQSLRAKLESFPDNDYALRDRARFTELLRLCGHI